MPSVLNPVSLDQVFSYFDRITGFIYFSVLSVMSVLTTKKLYCTKRDIRDDPDTAIPRSMKLSILLFCFLATIQSLSFSLTFIIPSLLCWFDIHPNILTLYKFCTTSIWTWRVSVTLYEPAVLNVVILRIDTAFRDTPYEIRKWVVNVIRLSAILIWSIALVLELSFPHSDEDSYGHGHDHEFSSGCSLDYLHDSPFTYGPFDLFILIILYRGGLYCLFMRKLRAFRKSLREHGSRASDHDHDFMLELMKHLSIIMWWICVLGISLVILLVCMDYQGSFRTFPLSSHNAMNGIAMFLSFSFNRKWFMWCQCHHCANCCYRLFSTLDRYECTSCVMCSCRCCIYRKNNDEKRLHETLEAEQLPVPANSFGASSESQTVDPVNCTVCTDRENQNRANREGQEVSTQSVELVVIGDGLENRIDDKDMRNVPHLEMVMNVTTHSSYDIDQAGSYEIQMEHLS